MGTLRIRHGLTGGGGSLIEVDYDPGEGAAGYRSEVPFFFELGDRDRARLRFYLEDQLANLDPSGRRSIGEAALALRRWGEEIFRQLFVQERKAGRCYGEAARDLSSLRIEIHPEHPNAWTIPWELLRDPALGPPGPPGCLAPRVRAFVRRTGPARHVPDRPSLRVLYAACPPAGGADLPFRSPVRSLLLAFAGHWERVRIDVLRPPTFERLSEALREAAEAGEPYLGLHFDGHAVLTDRPQDFAGKRARRRGGARGHLLFEDGPVDGVRLGELVARTGTPLVVLGACQSATERTEASERRAGEPPAGGRPLGPGEAPDEHEQDLAIVSLAQEVAAFAGAAAVALPWALPAVVSGRLLIRLYQELANGATVGEAVSAVRLDLLQPSPRPVIPEGVETLGWIVPVVYEPAEAPLVAPSGARLEVAIPEGEDGDAPAARLPRPPAWGFVDRPSAVLAIDRAFGARGTVLLHGYSGSGKTILAREAALWYLRSGGLGDGKILWSSFESYNPAAPFDEAEAALGIAAGSSDPGRRAEAVLARLRERPALWVWDNAEGIAAWPERERAFLAGFLRDLAATRCRVLLVSRRGEEAWLGDLPDRVALPPLSPSERAELAFRIAARHGLAPAEVPDLTPLLRFSEGNPLTLVVLVGEALRQGRRTALELEAFLEELRRGTSELAAEDDPLGASLRYGLGRAFGEEERRRLALLHLFQGFVDLNVLCWMGHPETSWCLPELRGVGREPWIALLDRAAEAGLLTPRGGDHYGLHPALPFFFRALFEQAYGGSELAATRAFAESMAGLGSWYRDAYRRGDRGVIAGLHAQEANLLHALELAQSHDWRDAVGHALQGLEILYAHTGRKEDWEELLRRSATPRA
jgi:hypothetical protein